MTFLSLKEIIISKGQLLEEATLSENLFSKVIVDKICN
jgi:hypothetical protein